MSCIQASEQPFKVLLAGLANKRMSTRPHTPSERLEITPVIPGKLSAVKVTTACLVIGTAMHHRPPAGQCCSRCPSHYDGQSRVMGKQAPISSCSLAEKDVLACNFIKHSGQQIHFFPCCICTSRKLGSSQMNEGLQMRVKGSLSPSATRAFLGTGHFSVGSQLHSYLLGKVLASGFFFPVPSSILGYWGEVGGDLCHSPRLAELSADLPHAWPPYISCRRSS